MAWPTVWLLLAVTCWARPAAPLSCLPCDRLLCDPVTCAAGRRVVKDACGCCDVCSRGRGEPCGGLFQLMGRCSDGLECLTTDGRPLTADARLLGVCVPAKCSWQHCQIVLEQCVCSQLSECRDSTQDGDPTSFNSLESCQFFLQHNVPRLAAVTDTSTATAARCRDVQCPVVASASYTAAQACPADSVAVTLDSDTIDDKARCCDHTAASHRCVCDLEACVGAPPCVAGRRAVLSSAATLQPGQCCDQWRCEPLTQQLNEQDICVNRTDVDESGAWMEDVCTMCLCRHGRRECHRETCPVSCHDARHVRGQCCPVCDECAIPCRHGYITSPSGESTCECLPSPDTMEQAIAGFYRCSEATNCNLECPFGRAEDEFGCHICACRSCPALSDCRLLCENGLKTDPNGCESCECRTALTDNQTTSAELDRRLTQVVASTEAQSQPPQTEQTDENVANNGSPRLVSEDTSTSESSTGYRWTTSDLHPTTRTPIPTPIEREESTQGSVVAVDSTTLTPATITATFTTATEPPSLNVTTLQTLQSSATKGLPLPPSTIETRRGNAPESVPQFATNTQGNSSQAQVGIGEHSPQESDTQPTTIRRPTKGDFKAVGMEIDTHYEHHLTYAQDPAISDACVLEDGSWKVPGSRWFDGCRTCRCHRGRAMCSLLTCPAAQCRRPVLSAGNCCPSCTGKHNRTGSITRPISNTTACTKSNVDGGVWKPDTCTNCTCIDGEVFCSRHLCPPTPCSRPVHLPGTCCATCAKVLMPFFRAKFCTVDGGVRRAPGYISGRGVCVSCVCLNGRQRCYQARCPPTNCSRPVLIKNACCPICLDNLLAADDTRCAVDGAIIEDGQVWSRDSCTQCECSGGALMCTRPACDESCPRPISNTTECCSPCKDETVPHTLDQTIVEDTKGVDIGDVGHIASGSTDQKTPPNVLSVVFYSMLAIIVCVLTGLLLFYVSRRRKHGAILGRKSADSSLSSASAADSDETAISGGIEEQAPLNPNGSTSRHQNIDFTHLPNSRDRLIAHHNTINPYVVSCT